MANDTGSNVLEVEARLKDFLNNNLKTMEANLLAFNKKVQGGFNQTEKASLTLKRGWENAKTSLTQFAQRFGPAAIATIALTKAMQGLGNAINFVRESAIAFEKTLSRVKAIIEPSIEDFTRLSNRAKQLGMNTVFSATQVGAAFVEMGKLGQKTNQIINASAAVLDLAALAQTDMANAATTTIQTLNQFRLQSSESTRIVDVMASSFNNSALDIEKFRASMKFAGAVAGATKDSIEDVTGALGVLADRGIDGSLAGTSLRRIMLVLADSTSKASKTVKKYNADATTLIEKLKALKEANLGITELQDLFTIRAVTAADALINSAESAEELSNKFKEAEGTAKRFAKTMLDNVAGDTVLLQSAQEGLGVAIGEAFGAAKRSRIQFYIKLIKRATGFVIAHKKELTDLSTSVSAAIKGLIWFFASLTQSIFGVIDSLGVLWFGLIEDTFITVRKVAEAFNWLAKKLGKEGDIIDLTFLNAQIEEFGTAAQTAADNAFSAFTGKPFLKTTLEDITRVKEELKELDDDIDIDVVLISMEEHMEKIKERIKELRAELKTLRPQISELNAVIAAGEAAQIRLNEAIINGTFDAQEAVLSSWASETEALALKNERELEILKTRQKAELEAFRGTQEAKKALTIAQELETTAMVNKQEDVKRKTVEKNAKSGLDMMVDNFKILAQANKKFMGIYKAAAIAQATIDTYAAAQAGYKAMSGIPYVGPALGAAAAAVAIAAGVANIAQISSASFASGTSFAPGGNALVGEQGVELVAGPKAGFLPRGSTVVNNSETRNLLGGNSVVFNLNVPEGAIVDRDAADLLAIRAENIKNDLIYAQSTGLINLDEIASIG